MSTYQIDYANLTTNDNLMILKGIQNFEDIEAAEEYIEEISWTDGKQYRIIDIKGIFVVYPLLDAQKLNKLFDYDIVDRPDSIKQYDKAKKALVKVNKIHSNKIVNISNDCKFINVENKNGKPFKQYRVSTLL